MYDAPSNGPSNEPSCVPQKSCRSFAGPRIQFSILKSWWQTDCRARRNLTQNERLYARYSTALWLHAGDAFEVELQLRKEQRNVAAAKDFRNERSAGREHVRRYVERRQKKMRLNELIDVVHAGHIGRAIAVFDFGFD